MADLQVLDRITVAIPSTQNVKNTTDHFTMYHVEITIHGVPIETWSVSKRYKEFLELNDELCKKYEVVKGFSFPKKTVVGKMKPETIEKRRKKLEQFIQKLLTTQLENDFLVRQFLALNNRGISILNRSHESVSPPVSKRETFVDVNLDPNASPKDNGHQSPKDSHAALAASNYEIEENNADHSEIITSASQSLSSSSDLSPHTSQMFARGQTPPPVATFINSGGNASPSPVTIIAEEDTRGSVSHAVPTPVPTSSTPKSPSGHSFGSLKNSLVPGEDNLVIEGLGLNAAIVGERAEISIKSALSGNIADRLWGELVQADAQVPLIVEPVGEGQYLASYIPFKSGSGTLNIFYLAPDGNKQPLITSQTVSIMVAPAYPSRSLAVGDAIKSPFYVGVTSCFIINSMDRLGNPVKFGGAQIRTTLKPITVIDSSIDTEKLVSVHVQDRNDGTYVVGVTPRAEGKYEMHVLLNGYDVKESPFKICVLAETEPHENNPECCPQHLEDELKTAEVAPSRMVLPINTTDAQLHEELKEALSSSPELQVDYSKLPPTTPRDNVINSQ